MIKNAMQYFTTKSTVPVKALRVLLVAIFFSTLGFIETVAAQTASIIPRPPEVAASSYVLMDATTGTVLVEHDKDLPLPPASLTKIMTTYVAEVELDNGTISLDDQVHVSVKAWQAEGSKMFIQEGTSVRLEDIMRGIIIQSGNDASIALAEHIAGSEDAFADMMNQYAQVLGMNNSFFTDASGLSNSSAHTMSAYDLAILAQAVINQFPQHYAIYGEKEFTYNDITQANRNSLLFRDSSVDGMKTGYTSAAGYCLVASAVRGDMRLIAVVMGTASEDARAVEAQKLLTYGFRFYDTTNLFEEGEELTSQKVWSGNTNSVRIGIPDTVTVTLPRSAADDFETVIEVDEVIKAPLEAGQVLGNVKVTAGGETFYEGPVVALDPIEKGGIFKRIMDWLHLLILGFLK
jgi:D-alanyl-D-alanine carboxypeptidase (penicillin-binding protein 5/6)